MDNLEDADWVNIPYDGFLEVQSDGDGKIFSRQYVKSPAKLFKPNYFDTQQQKSQDFVRDEAVFERPTLSFPSKLDHGDQEVQEIIKLPILIKESKETTLKQEADQDPISPVFFMKENKFVEMKRGSPRQNSRETDTEEKIGDQVVNCSSPTKMIKQEVVDWEESSQRLKFWKWGLSGIGSFCSMGMAAITICIIIFGNGRRHKLENQKIQIQFCADNKRRKQVVQNANEAVLAMRGVPLVKAEITYGGFYESL